MFGFVSCATEVYDYGSKEAHGNIATDISVEQVKATGNENLSRGESKAPAMRTFKVEGAKGDMFLRYTAAAGISGKEFDISVANESRGKMITTDNFYDDYGLFMYEYPNTDTWTNSSVSSLALPAVVNERVLKATGWETNEIWPGMGARLALYGYAPYNAAGVSALPTATTTGKPTFHYIVPTEAIDQKDLLVSEDDQYVSPSNINGGVDVPGDYYAIKTLKFKHACTAVRIAVGDQMAPCTITKIAIKGVYGEADYNYGAGTNLNEGAWENYSTTLSNYTLTADFTVSATDQNKVINDGRYTFMLLPQTVPAGAVIEITLNDGEQHVLKANIGSSNWEMGYSITYFITTSRVDDKYVLLLSSTDNGLLSTGSNKTIKVQSYKQSFYGSQVAVPWILTYNCEDDVLGNSGWKGAINDVVTSVTAFNGNGSVVGENTTFQVAKQVERSKPWRSTHTATLRAATEQGTESSPVDLSAGKQTANCYVISAPGYYKFPLVYGNARNADGSANTDAYGTATFVDHQGVQIDDPYIYQTNGGTNVPASAIIVWQDAPHLINPSSVKLSSDKHYIEFQIRKEDICQGNSVLAVCDANGTIMWSWHIWVTDHSMTNTIELHNNPDAGGSVISYLMEVPLGYCDAEVRVRDKRTFNFKVTQTETGGKDAIISFEQLSADSLYTYGNNAPYFQWGRKDPMLQSNGIGNYDKLFYDNKRPWQRIASQVSTCVAIQNPFTFYTVSNGDWSTTHNWDYWNINFQSATSINNTPTKKTIYDPSVSGFCLPRTAAFTGISLTGSNTTDGGQFNVSGGFNKGWNFFTGVNSSTIFFDAFGYREIYNATGYVVRVGEEGDFWESGAYSVSNGLFFFFYSSGLYPQWSNCRSYGLSVRSALEDNSN